MVGSYITNGNSNLSNGLTANGIPPLVVKTTPDTNAYMTLSIKYATIYPYAMNDTRPDNYTAYKNANYGYGDALLETSVTGENSMSWFGDKSYFSTTIVPFLVRGGSSWCGSDTGIFSFSDYGGGANIDFSFRTVLIPM